MRLTSMPVLFALLAAPAMAQQSSPTNRVEAGGYVVFYNALPTTQLTPEVAGNYGIRRSANRGLLNIVVHRKTDEGLTEPVTAEVEATATNLLGQIESLQMREVRETDAIYYLAEVGVEGRETLTFDVTARPEGGPPIQVRFSQPFYGD